MQTRVYALKDGGVITTYTPAGESDVYKEGVEYFNNQPIYAKIVEMGANEDCRAERFPLRCT